MKLIPLKLNKPVEPGENYIARLAETIDEYGIRPVDGDIVAIAMKVVAISRGAFLGDCTPSETALRLSREYMVDPCIAQWVLDNADYIIGGSRGIITTIYKGILVGNAGLDQKNSAGYVATRWPDDIEYEASRVREYLCRKYSANIAVVIVDSRAEPLRRGTRGFAVSIAGFNPIKSYIGKVDIYGRVIKYTTQNIADSIAAAAHIYMGEGDELTPYVYIRDAPIELGSEYGANDLKIPIENCIYLAKLIKSDSSK